MSKWSNIAKLSDRHEKARAAQFEAQMLATLAPANTPQPPPAPATPPATAAPTPDRIHISVTANGHTTHYPDLLTVPTPLRQQILNTWLTNPTPPPTTPPILTAPTTPRPPVLRSSQSEGGRTLRFALTLNLLLPGASQLYLGQPLLAAAYALPFLATVATALAIFLRAYAHYLRLATTGDLLEPGNLETLTHAFPAALLATLTTISTAIFFASTIHLIIKRPRSV